MKPFIIIFLLLIPSFGFSQNNRKLPETIKKGELYFYWGWNREWFTNSDIHFTGNDYDFTLHNVTASDKPAEFDMSTYFSPKYITIPQYNFRLGYFINDHYDLSISIDHMKYVVDNDQIATITGEIDVPNSGYNGIYSNDQIKIRRGLLALEHSDGLNWGGLDIKRFDNILDFNKIKIGLTEGIGVAIIFPKTDAHLLNYKRYDKYHVSGFGAVSSFGLNVRYKKVFIQSELKLGYVNMPKVRTTQYTSDNATQSFYFSQFNVVFGAAFDVSSKNK